MRERLRRTRVRLTLAYAAVFLVVAACAAAGFWFAFRHLEYTSLDTSLDSQAQALVTGLDTSAGRVTFNGNDILPGESNEGIAITAVLLDASGKVLDRSGTGTGTPPQSVLTDAMASGRVAQTLSLGGQKVRMLAKHVDLGDGRSAVLVLTRPTAEVESALREMALLLMTAVVVLTVVASLLGYRLAGRALRPVRVMAETARDISEHGLHRRLIGDLPADELGDLATTLNGMLQRLESAFTTLQRFTADAAHELRAPLALIRAELEVSLKRERTPEEYRESLQAALTEIERLSRMADQLLILARADAGVLTPAWTTVDLPDLLEDVVERWRPLAREHDVTISVTISSEGTVEADPDLLRRAFDNLIDNAVRYTRPRGDVRVSASMDGTEWSITVADTGPGVDPSLVPTLFERFTRADIARGRASGGAGLGLSLCRAIIDAHGGTIRLESGTSEGATFVVTLPATRLPDGTSASGQVLMGS